MTTKEQTRLSTPYYAFIRMLFPLVLLLGACSEKLITSPYVMRGEAGRRTYASLDPALQTPEINVVYVTDRGPTPPDKSGPRYGHERSDLTSYGNATVELSPRPTWDELVEISTSGQRSRSYTLRVSRVEERGRFTPITEYMEVKGNRIGGKIGARDAIDAENRAFGDVLRERLVRTDRKEVVIFIHGFNNSFDDAVIRLAQAWHFSGRRGVPIVYTWPAGFGGLAGYAYDRESGEFTVVHLKLLLRAVAACPEVEKMHIVSHSRGTDVATTALRELNAEFRGMSGKSLFSTLVPESSSPVVPPDFPTAAEVLKLGTVVLAAPDLDVDVFRQRFFGENLVGVADRFVLYFSKEDEALGLANWLFSGRSRIGSLHVKDLKPAALTVFASLPRLEVINCEVSGFTTHAYVFQHPAALSDLILVLRDGATPGAHNGRPLSSPEIGVWEMDNTYLRPASKTAR